MRLRDAEVTDVLHPHKVYALTLLLNLPPLGARFRPPAATLSVCHSVMLASKTLSRLSTG